MNKEQLCLCNSKQDLSNWSNFCIGQLWLFEGLKPEELEAFGHKVVRRKFEKGQPVFLQGDQVQSIFLVKKGSIRLIKVLENGTEVFLDIRKAGDYLGEYILNDLNTVAPYAYPVSAWCMDEVCICGFTKKIFEEMVLEYPSIGLKVIKTMAGRITSLNERIGAMSQVHLEEKIYSVLLNVAREFGRTESDGYYSLDMPLTHEDLGFLVGAHRVSVTRIMKRLKETGRISHDGKIWLIQNDDFTLVAN